MAPTGRGKPLAWDADLVQGKSSLGVLLDWLTVGGNYQRWVEAGRDGMLAKEALSYEVVSLLQGQGIRHRTFRGVWRKIDDLARNVDLAQRLLARNGLEGAVTLEGCGPLLRAEIQRRWPYFELLAPLMAVPVQATGAPIQAANETTGAKQPEESSSGSAKEQPTAEAPATESGADQQNQSEREQQDAHESNAIFMLANLVNRPLVPLRPSGASIQATSAVNGQDADAQSLAQGRPKRSPVASKKSREYNEAEISGRPLPRWDSDRVRGKSSLDVLITWLRTGDNYVRWRSARAKSPITKEMLCTEMNSLLQEQGIHYRKNLDIRKKLWLVEDTVTKANQLMAENGKESLDDCDALLRTSILRLCPQFETLAPIMKPFATIHALPEIQLIRSQNRKRRASDHSIASKSPGALAATVSDTMASRSAASTRFSALGRQNEPNQVVGSSNPTNSDSVAAEIGPHRSLQQPQTSDNYAGNETNHVRNIIEHELIREKHKLELDLLRTQRDCELDTDRKKQKLGLETMRTKAELELERSKYSLQITREKNEFALVVERAVSRQKLLNAGIVQSELDLILPSKPCSV